ncbi:MAG: hypothetical protein PWQ82_636 [Thermosediminibacterales bacterium]|nr:hypothetical protein [Thermosediminibacterales bacterium]MDK2835858.1 hypothetical protein [Thermosediminibacterales bacterium]
MTRLMKMEVFKLAKNLSTFQILRLLKRIPAVFSFLLDPQVPFTRKIIILGGLLYFLLPIDFIPDPVLGFGFIDDGVVLLLILMKLSEELDKYVKKNEQKKTYYENKNEDFIDISDYDISDDE